MVKGFLNDDVILICSDGLTNMVKEQEIYDYVKEDINNATDKLVQRANEMGGYDNITVIVIQNN